MFVPRTTSISKANRRRACGRCIALVATLLLCDQIDTVRAVAQDAPPNGTSTETSSSPPNSQPPSGAPDDPKASGAPDAAPNSRTLPPVTVTSPTAPKAKPKQPLRPAAASVRRTAPTGQQKPAPAPATRSLPEGIVLRGGPPVEWTTAGPVSGYRALTAVTATKTDTPIEQIPQSIQVIPRSVIDDQQPLTQSEALRNVSGVIGMPTNTYVGSAYKVRGFPADRFVDGLPNYFDGGDFVSLVNTERIEVLKGPSGILYQAGLNPVGGIINSISKLPTPARSYEAGFMAGGFGLWNPWFDINQPLNRDGTALFRVTGDFERSRDYIDVIQRQRYSLNPTLLLNNNDGTRLTIQGRFTAREFQAYNGLPGAGTIDRSVFSIRDNLFPSTPNLPTTTTTYNGLTARLDHELTSAWSFNVSARISQGDLRNFVQIPQPNAPLFGSTFAFANGYFPLDVTEFSVNPNLVGKFTIGGVKNVLLIGTDYDRVATGIRFDAAFAGLVNLANPAFPPYVLPTPGPPATVLDTRETTQNSGLTAQLQSTIWDRLHLLVGARAAHITIQSADHVHNANYLTEASKMLPRVGGVLDLVPGVSVFADYSEGFRAVPFFNGSGPPKPEEANQTEGGVKLVLPSGFAGTLAWFTITRRNVVSPLPGSPVLMVQIGEQRSQGFEADVTWQPIPGLSMLASYAHIDARIVQDQLFAPGKRLDRVPADSGRFWVNYKFQDGPLRNVAVGAGVYAASSQAISPDNQYFTSAYATIDGKISYDIDQWTFALIGKNLTNTRYFQPFPLSVGWVAPGEPLTVYAMTKKKY
jgi:iron complex outermembrane receptor protein